MNQASDRMIVCGIVINVDNCPVSVPRASMDLFTFADEVLGSEMTCVRYLQDYGIIPLIFPVRVRRVSHVGKTWLLLNVYEEEEVVPCIGAVTDFIVVSRGLLDVLLSS